MFMLAVEASRVLTWNSVKSCIPAIIVSTRLCTCGIDESYHTACRELPDYAIGVQADGTLVVWQIDGVDEQV